MSTEQGQKLAGALKAIAQLHADTSRLLLDCDRHIGNGRNSVFQNYATRDLTYAVRAPYWMAEGVYRFYEAGPRLVDAVTVTFFKPGEESEPLLKIGRIEYARRVQQLESEPLRQMCKEWDLWWLFFKSGGARDFNEVLEYKEADNHRIACARLITVPLVTVRRIEDVCELMSRVVESFPKSESAKA
jgi:hypothetical protein